MLTVEPNTPVVAKGTPKMHPTQLDDVFARIEKEGIEYREVKPFTTQPTDTELIEKLGGGDKTGGSCVSQAFAYAGVRCGLDVEDYRGGWSCELMSKGMRIREMVLNLGGKIQNTNKPQKTMIDLIKSLPDNSEAIIGGTGHCSIVRKYVDKNNEIKLEHLELQSNKKELNKWYELTSERLKTRFNASKTTKYEKRIYLLTIAELRKHPALLRKLLGYINTAKDKQKKGDDGGIK